METNELQNKWSKMNTQISNIDDVITIEESKKMKTAQERLAAQYKSFIIMGGIFAIFIPLMMYNSIYFPLPMALSFSAYFILAMVMDLILYLKVCAIDFSEMSVVDVAYSAYKCRRLHHICQIILIPCAIALIGITGYQFISEPYILWGMIVGAVIGLCLGLTMYFKMMSNYKTLISKSNCTL